MDESFAARLGSKGWTTEEIDRVSGIIAESEQKKPTQIKFLDGVVYWGALLLAIFGNMVLSIVLIPFLLALRDFLLYTIIITIGVAFGLLFDLLIRDIDNLGNHHYIIAGLFIPCLAIINMIFMASFANTLTASINLKNIHPPFLVGTVYTIAFTIPYAISHFKERYKRKSVM